MSQTESEYEFENDVRLQEGFDKLNKSKQEELERKFREQKKMKDLNIEDYNPWGKPGAGAPNNDSLRKRKIFMDVLPPINTEENREATNFGRPGAGAPLRSKSGNPMYHRTEDPQLRFQFHGPVRKIVDVDLRYRVPLMEQQAYKEELDEMIKTKQKIDCKNKHKDDVKALELGIEGGTFRRLGSHPQDNKILYDTLSDIDESIRIEELTGGLELAPLLAIRRRKDKKYPLHSTDVTSELEVKPHLQIDGKEYDEFLKQQIECREHHKQEEKMHDIEKSNQHFENWEQFWGRPGHGAPRPIKVKENLEYILYHLPVLIRKQQQTDEQSN